MDERALFGVRTCEPISEEPESPAVSGPRRHHRPRTLLTRTNSAPQFLISTTTTSPVYFNMSASLMPRSDSYPARVRGTSHMDFKAATTGVAAKAMRNELSTLVSTVSDPQTRKVRLAPVLYVQTDGRPIIRPSMPRCSHFSISSLAISPNAPSTSICKYRVIVPISPPPLIRL